MKRFQITEAEYKAIKAKEAETKDKKVSRRLRALMLWYEGKSLKEIGAILNVHPMSVNQMCRRYREQGLGEYARKKHESHYSQEQMAEKLGISRQHLASVEAPGMDRGLSLELLFNIATVLEIEPYMLLKFKIEK